MSRGQAGRIRIVAPVVLLALVFGGYAFWRHFSGSESTDDAQVDGHIYPVNAKVGGTIAAVNVAENQVVEAGTVLVVIDDRDFRIALSRAQADLAGAQAGYSEARASLPVTSAQAGGRMSHSEAALARAESAVVSAQKELDVARARLNLANSRALEVQTVYAKAMKDLDRLRPLIAKDEISQQQYDAAVSAVDSAKAALDSSKAAIAEAASGVGAGEARVAESRAGIGLAESEAQTANAAPQEVEAGRARISAAAARIAQAEAAIEQVRSNMDYTVVRAPVAGIVSRKSVEIGQVVQSGHPVLAIVPLEDVWVTANFKETQLEQMRPGQSAEIRVDAYGGAVFKGKVDSIAAATGGKFSLLPAENASGNYVKVVQRVPVRLALEAITDKSHILRPGMSVAVKVLTAPVQ